MPVNDLVFLHGNHFPECLAEVNKRFDGYYVLQYMRRGALELQYDQRIHRLEGRWFWMNYPGPRIRFHTARSGVPWDHRYIAFRGPRVNDWLAASLLPEGPLRAPKRKRYDRIMDAVIDLALSSGRLDRLRAANLLESILLDLAEQCSHPTIQRAPWLEEVLVKLSDPNAYPFDYDALAADVGMGTSTLRRKFRQEMGFPMHHFALQHRMASARSLLLETDVPIKTLSARLGFRDVYFFARQFKQFTGLTPGAFRKSREV